MAFRHLNTESITLIRKKRNGSKKKIEKEEGEKTRKRDGSGKKDSFKQ